MDSRVLLAGGPQDPNFGGGRLASVADGGVVVSFNFTQPTAFAGQSYHPGPAGDLLVARLEHSGAVRWVWRADGGSTNSVFSTSLTTAGDEVVVAGRYSGPLTLGAEVLPDVGNTVNVFVARLGANGLLRWARRVPQSTWEPSVAVAPDGSVVVATIADNDSGLRVSRYAPDGSLMDSALVALNSGSVRITSIAIAPDGSTFISGAFTGTMSQGGTTLMAPMTSPTAFVLRRGTNTGESWLKAVAPGPGSVSALVAALPDGSVIVAGNVVGPTVAGTTFTSAGQQDIYLVSYDPAGARLWLRTEGGLGDDTIMAIAPTPARDAVDLIGFGQLRAPGGQVSTAAAFTARLGADGTIRRLSPLGALFDSAVVVSVGSRLWVSGAHQGNAIVAGLPLPSVPANTSGHFVVSVDDP